MEKKSNKTNYDLLVTIIKESVAKGMKKGFLEAAEALFFIKEHHIYKIVKPKDDKFTFEKYCIETIFLPGNTPNGRLSVASKLLLIYKFYKSRKISKDELLSLGYAKSYELAKFSRKYPNENLERQIKLAHEFNHHDFTRMLYEKDCMHKDVITVRMCKRCKRILEVLD